MPLIGDDSSARDRASAPDGWAFEVVQGARSEVIAARRDIRRYRPDPVPADALRAVVAAGHAALSVDHSQPWRFTTRRGVARVDAVSQRAAAVARP